MTNEIRKQLEKAYIAAKHADSLNEVRLNPDPILRNKLITINELLKECMNEMEEA